MMAAFSLPFFWTALVASLVLAGTHAYLGFHIVRRGVIFVDLALAQMAALGVALAHRGTGRLVIDIQPDGDLMFAPGVLWTAARP